MADGRGGYRKPSNPAPASGPGKLSKRTDGGPSQRLMAPTGMDYGAHAALLAQERTAPMSQVASPPQIDIPSMAQSSPGYQGPALDDPTQRPDEPVTQGVDIGAGDGPEALGLQPGAQKPDGYMTQTLSSLSASDMTGQLAKLFLMAQQTGA